MAEVKYNLGTLAVVPTGAVIPFAGSTAPQGYLLCDGRDVSRTDYHYLFDVIGTTYGKGDGSTTFNLPNLRDVFVQGAGTNVVGAKMSAGLPNITGSLVTWKASGAFGGTSSEISKGLSTGSAWNNVTKGRTSFDASRSNSIYGNSNTVQPPAVCMNYIIKY